VIRAATPADADRLVALAQHFLAATAYGQLLPVQKDRLLALVEPVCTHGVVFVSELDRPFAPELVGMIAISVAEHALAGLLFGDELVWWVEPSFRDRRGTALLERAEAWGVEHGLAFLRMVAPAESPTVGKLYERHGYAPVETSYVKQLTPRAA